MKSLAVLALLALALPACLDSSTPLFATDSSLPETDLADVMLGAQVSDDGAQVSLTLSKAGIDPLHNAAKRSDCLRVHPSIVVTANQQSPDDSSIGAFDDGDGGFETNCEPPWFEFDFIAGAPAAVDFELDDGTADLHVQVVSNTNGNAVYTSYTVTRCDAASCTAM